jgi:hypothetical protein
MKKTRRGFAIGSPQRNRMALMFGAALLLRAGFKRLICLRISHHAARHTRRDASCGTSASSNERFPALRRHASRHTTQALATARFFTHIDAPEAANCLQFAATRLKFAASPLDSHRRPPGIKLKPFSRRPISSRRKPTASRGYRQKARRSPPPPPSPATPDACAP